MTRVRHILAAVTLAVAAAFIGSATTAKGDVLAYDGLSGTFVTGGQEKPLNSVWASEFGSCCNCSCGWEGCTIIFQGRTCQISGGVCTPDECTLDPEL